MHFTPVFPRAAAPLFERQPLAMSLAIAFALPLLLTLAAPAAHAQPMGGTVAAGQAVVGGTAAATTVTQTSANAVINWQSFGVRAGESVQFIQPGSSSVTLNRVTGGDPSSILGSLSANGKVFIVNPAGVLFGNTASVNVGGLLASSLDIGNADFMAGDYRFSGSGTGTVSNAGQITAADGGYVALLGPRVANQGLISATMGSVVLAAGRAVTVQVGGDGLLNVAVAQGAMDALVSNGGVIRADGGQILMTTQAAGSLLSNAVNNTGLVQAQTLRNVSGSIKLLGGMSEGTVTVGGTLDASAPAGGNGGFVETSAHHVRVAADSFITTAAPSGKTGLWLLDPVDYRIALAGGDETPGQVATSLATSNRVITATNDITVADALTWTTPQTLTLDAGHDVRVLAPVTASTAGSGIVFIAGNDVIVNAAVTASGAASVVRMTAGRDVVSTDVLTASQLNAVIDLAAGRDISVNVVTANAGGSVRMTANNSITVNGIVGADSGLVTLTADADGTGPGAAAGTVLFAGAGSVVAPNTIIRFNPDGYANTSAEIAGYIARVTGILDARAWVFAQANNKVYDGNTAAVLAFRGTPNDDVGGVVSLNGGTANFNDRNVGTGKAVTYAGYSVGGVNPGRFELFGGGAGTVQANITPLAITGGITAADKVYDGNTSATITGYTLAGVLAGDVVNYQGGTATFIDKNVGNAKLVTGNGLVLAGAQAGNYTVNPAAVTAASITAAPLTITAADQLKASGQNLTFTGSEFTSTGLQASETVGAVSLSSPGAVASASSAGNPYVITASNASGGTFTPGNYSISYTSGQLVVSPTPTSPPTAGQPGTTLPAGVLPTPVLFDVGNPSATPLSTSDLGRGGSGDPSGPTGTGTPGEPVTGGDNGRSDPPLNAVPPALVVVPGPPLSPPLQIVQGPGPGPLPVPVPAGPVNSGDMNAPAPIVAPSPVYVAPLRARKQDRN
ncbi:MAG: filamentous hemagglutinin N-terminal domain-containing protein [Comamonadaceae bacterium]|nr:MAG: filamentous hemagglutinin N-terminal domain-containing protein [Comamonadaceae bacterium]